MASSHLLVDQEPFSLFAFAGFVACELACFDSQTLANTNMCDGSQREAGAACSFRNYSARCVRGAPHFVCKSRLTNTGSCAHAQERKNNSHMPVTAKRGRHATGEGATTGAQASAFQSGHGREEEGHGHFGSERPMGFGSERPMGFGSERPLGC